MGQGRAISQIVTYSENPRFHVDAYSHQEDGRRTVELDRHRVHRERLLRPDGPSSKFLELKCPHQGNVHEFLDNLHVKKEELATVGVIIEDGDYHSTILSSIPTSLANFASMQLDAARMYSSETVKTISPNILISLINEEADCQKVQKTC